MKKIITILLVVASLTLSATTIKVKYVGGVAYKKNNQGQTKITAKSSIKAGDTIITKSRSFVALLLSDKSVHKVTANTIYEVKSLSENKNSRTQLFSIKKGKVFNYVSKSFKKSNIKFITPTAIVGVRGTAFAIETGSEGTSVFLTSGIVDVGKYRDGQTSQVTVMQAGNYATVGNSVQIQKMTQSDYEDATEGVPVKLGAVQLVPKEAKAKEVAQAILKQEIRSAVSTENQRVDTVNQAQAREKKWDSEFKKQVGPYTVRQYFRKENSKTIVLDTYTSSPGKEYLLGLNLTFNGRIPTLADRVNKTARDIDRSQMTIRGTVDNKTDTLVYTKNNIKGTKSVSLNGKKATDTKKDPIKEDAFEFRDTSSKILTQAIPKKLEFKIGDSKFAIDFSIGFTDGAKDEDGKSLDHPKYKPDHKLTDIDKQGVLDKVLDGDLDTQIKVGVTGDQSKLNGKAFNLNDKRGFDLILLNNFFIPLLQN